VSKGNRRRKSRPLFGSLSLSFFDKKPRSKNGVTHRHGAFGKTTESPQASASYLLLFVVLAVLATGGLIYHLHLRFEGVRLGYETSRARADRAQLVAERRELRLELSSLKSPERIETEAREKLGMEMPSMEQIVPMEKRATPVLASGRAR
jgi:cell division protein FtsL